LEGSTEASRELGHYVEVLIEPDRTCTNCRETKPATAFHLNGNGRRLRRCGSCVNARRPSRPGNRWPKRSPEERRSEKLRQLYGITLEQERQMLAAQDGGCAICGKPAEPGRPLAVDHCHSSGRVRALLCLGCNTQLGAYENFRTRAEEYLAKYGRGNPQLGYGNNGES
jgi:hypothetical protein